MEEGLQGSERGHAVEGVLYEAGTPLLGLGPWGGPEGHHLPITKDGMAKARRHQQEAEQQQTGGDANLEPGLCHAHLVHPRPAEAPRHAQLSEPAGQNYRKDRVAEGGGDGRAQHL